MKRNSIVAMLGVVIVGGTVLVQQSASGEPTRTQTTQTTQTDTTPTTGTDPCTLLTEAEARTTLGSAVTPIPDAGQCTYVTLDGSGRAVSVSLSPAIQHAESLAPAMDQVAELLHTQKRVIPDLGGEAYGIASHHVTEVIVLNQDRFLGLVLTMPTGTVDEQLSTLEDLARTAMSRL